VLPLFPPEGIRLPQQVSASVARSVTAFASFCQAFAVQKYVGVKALYEPMSILVGDGR
jgi:hypothetical protein